MTSPPAAIIERAFSYRGLLVRTFHRADAPVHPLQPAPDADEPPPKRRRGPKSSKAATTLGVNGREVKTCEETSQDGWVGEGVGIAGGPLYGGGNQVGEAAVLDRQALPASRVPVPEGPSAVPGVVLSFTKGPLAVPGAILSSTERPTTTVPTLLEGSPTTIPLTVPSHHVPFSEPTIPAPTPDPNQNYSQPPETPPHPSPTIYKRDPKPPSHICDSLPSFLTHITAVITSANSGFIPRPINVSYTIPLPPSTDPKPFALSLIRDIAAIDHCQWTIAHSQWTAKKASFNAGARWVCNMSEEGVRYRKSQAGKRYTCTDGTRQSRTRYPCGGFIGIRFSSNKPALTFRYMHHAVHCPPEDLKEIGTGRELAGMCENSVPVDGVGKFK